MNDRFKKLEQEISMLNWKKILVENKIKYKKKELEALRRGEFHV